jgi:hypothetical protein
MKYAFPFMCMLPLAFTLNPRVAQAANYELGTPFPMTCVGILQSKGGQYWLTADDSHLNSNSDDDHRCQGATIAERSGKSALVNPQRRNHSETAECLFARQTMRDFRSDEWTHARRLFLGADILHPWFKHP